MRAMNVVNPLHGVVEQGSCDSTGCGDGAEGREHLASPQPTPQKTANGDSLKQTYFLGIPRRGPPRTTVTTPLPERPPASSLKISATDPPQKERAKKKPRNETLGSMRSRLYTKLDVLKILVTVLLSVGSYVGMGFLQVKPYAFSEHWAYKLATQVCAAIAIERLTGALYRLIELEFRSLSIFRAKYKLKIRSGGVISCWCCRRKLAFGVDVVKDLHLYLYNDRAIGMVLLFENGSKRRIQWAGQRTAVVEPFLKFRQALHAAKKAKAQEEGQHHDSEVQHRADPSGVGKDHTGTVRSLTFNEKNNFVEHFSLQRRYLNRYLYLLNALMTLATQDGDDEKDQEKKTAAKGGCNSEGNGTESGREDNNDDPFNWGGSEEAAMIGSQIEGPIAAGITGGSASIVEDEEVHGGDCDCAGNSDCGCCNSDTASCACDLECNSCGDDE